MENSRRRQLHSCDPCRKGKRGCDAPRNRNDSGFSCSNCKRWKKECTFNWLLAKPTDPRNSRKRPRTNATDIIQNPDLPSIPESVSNLFDEPLLSSQWNLVNSGDIFASPDSRSFASTPFFETENKIFNGIEWSGLADGQPGINVWDIRNPGHWQTDAVIQESGDASRQLGYQSNTEDSLPSLSESRSDATQDLENRSISSSSDFTDPEYQNSSQSVYSTLEFNPAFMLGCQPSLSTASNNTAKEYARVSMTRNLIHIYHDSMENALSCWLTEHNCPYSDSTGGMVPYRKMKEWGPSWSNRMCIRVCRLDRASDNIRGRALTAEEEKLVYQALHLAIMAFASQWTQHAEKGSVLNVPSVIDEDERAIRVNIWNRARHALEHSVGIPSFRVIFANIIFSLTQSPLDKGQDLRLDELLENDRAPLFLENANRQLFTLRYKFMRLQRQANSSRAGSKGSTTADVFNLPTPPVSPQVDPVLGNEEHRNTIGLLFWLGVMFDTLSAAMYQRPLVVSDEDSQVTTVSPPMLKFEEHIDLDGWNLPNSSSRQKKDVWGDFFLRYPRQKSSQIRWPCSYDEAASVLSEATPVKVLLYRRITQLQTLLYRGASGDRLEEIMKKAILVYQHWNAAYQPFMKDCISNHEFLPPRIQSWYIILDGHWHLATMLLADVIESIDQARLGSDIEREVRQTTKFVSVVRADNALAVGELARSSLQGQDPMIHGRFHDSLSEVALLVEPWTVVLIHSFAKAGYISLERLEEPDAQNVPTERFKKNCELCISALQYLGRKSDMASLVARNLSRSLVVIP
ncbi:hypothetical protein N7495_005964 [Penicillium taxi]|uniref:uncharacterized protein n=1 Tax=Penicillium taxi TaxID=168475 RepID=UPI002545587D|nr:uncharacterized protein N7495_005964 [Penicillium taxi]KAJ5894273.1 hypothetical protein N7495_005964 [Penicillium taxi]